jgi:hypothetical protein
MHLRVVEDAITTCKKHLEKPENRQPEIEAYLTRYLLILIYAAYEQKIRDILFEKAGSISDSSLSSFIKSLTVTVTRRIRSADLNNLLERFSSEHKAEFSRTSQTNSKAWQAYNSIVSNRNIIAHDAAQSVTMTFEDLEKGFRESLKVLDAFANVLGVGREI